MKKIIIVLISCTFVIAGLLFFLLQNKDKRENIVKTDFNSKLIRLVNKSENDNYLISPYSIEMALSILREGTDTTTLKEIDDLIGRRVIPTFLAKKRINVANAMFLKDIYKDKVKNEFINTLKDNYDAEVIIDKFNKPDVINEWVNNKTYKMLPKIIDELDPLFVLGLANAIAIDVEWANKFECTSTSPIKFDNGKDVFDVEMMHAEYRDKVRYISNDEIKGVILPYVSYDEKGNATDDDGISLEFIGILPRDINSFMKDFSTKKFNKIIDSFKSLNDDETLALAIPRFKYDYKLDLKNVLIELGVKEIFSNNADFTRIFGQIGDLTISDAIHKTHIELNESGTKAAAVTYFGMRANAMIEEQKMINIDFDEPFMYAIREVKTKEILFVGVVYNPNKWSKSTCEKEE